MSSYISDDSSTGQQVHIICDGCNAEALVPFSLANIDVRETPKELVGWLRSIGLRDLCPDCQATLDAAPPRR